SRVSPECRGLAADPFTVEDAARDGQDLSAALIGSDSRNRATPVTELFILRARLQTVSALDTSEDSKGEFDECLWPVRCLFAAVCTSARVEPAEHHRRDGAVASVPRRD